jgi:hypothetical protein
MMRSHRASPNDQKEFRRRGRRRREREREGEGESSVANVSEAGVDHDGVTHRDDAAHGREMLHVPVAPP